MAFGAFLSVRHVAQDPKRFANDPADQEKAVVYNELVPSSWG
jgi:hypothetical protein